MDPDLIEIRCRSCGIFLGLRKAYDRPARSWCSIECADTPMAKWPESDVQIRDEVSVELFLQGLSTPEIARSMNWHPYQAIRGSLTRRGITPGLAQGVLTGILTGDP